ncbi:MAG: hypothetical protein WDZ30_03105 [Cellvibrionaceae bacterium]
MLVLICLLFTAGASANQGCSALARSELEQLYCTIKATSAGAGLPSLGDFRRNDETVQALLLKQPARRLGLAVPDVSVIQPAPRERKTEPAKRSTGPRQAVETSQPIAEPVDSLHGCQMFKREIRCPTRHYRLVDNMGNHALEAGALGVHNTFELARFTGDFQDKQAVNRYLAESYRHYIEKMLSIGLGGVTMSYTRFHRTFRELGDKNEDFAARSATMFRYLKQDKSSMAIAPRHEEYLPTSIEQCFDLSDTLVICDDRDRNWVFKAGE